MIYILTFLVSSAFVWIGTRECTKRKMEDGMWKTVRLKKIPVLIGLLLPALLASMRAVSVGSDVSFYVVPLFNKAINSNSFSDYVAILGGDINRCWILFIELHSLSIHNRNRVAVLCYRTNYCLFYICRMLATQRKSLSMVEYAILLFFVLQHYIKHCKTVMCFGNFVFCTFLSF